VSSRWRAHALTSCRFTDGCYYCLPQDAAPTSVLRRPTLTKSGDAAAPLRPPSTRCTPSTALRWQHCSRGWSRRRWRAGSGTARCTRTRQRAHRTACAAPPLPSAPQVHVLAASPCACAAEKRAGNALNPTFPPKHGSRPSTHHANLDVCVVMNGCCVKGASGVENGRRFFSITAHSPHACV
jgi:hypothetical protein